MHVIDSPQMVTSPSTSYPNLTALPRIAAEQILALDCTLLSAHAGVIPLEGVNHHTFNALTAEMLAKLAPTVVIMPLFTTEHDALAMVEALEALSFTGRIVVMAPALPNPKLVERELRAAGPGVRLTLVTP